MLFQIRESSCDRNKCSRGWKGAYLKGMMGKATVPTSWGIGTLHDKITDLIINRGIGTWKRRQLTLGVCPAGCVAPF